MKKIFLMVTVLAACTLTRAQFGITGGFNVAKYKYTSDRGNLLSFNAGLVYRAKLNQNWSVQPELLYTVKGAVKYPDIDVSNDVLKYTNRINYTELSLPFIVSPELDGDANLRFDFGVGPYAAYLVKGTYTAETFEGDKSTGSYKIGSSGGDDFKPFDAGLTFLYGIRAWNVNFNLQYDLGLANTNPTTGGDALKMRAFMMNLIVYFGK